MDIKKPNKQEGKNTTHLTYYTPFPNDNQIGGIFWITEQNCFLSKISNV